jgi:hypothetical protein
VEHATDLTAYLKQPSGLGAAFPFQPARGDEAKHSGGGPDGREPKVPPIKPCDMHEPNLHIDTLRFEGAEFQIALSSKEVGKWDIVLRNRPALYAGSAVLRHDGVDLVHDCRDDLRVVIPNDDRFDKFIERMQ